MITICTNILSIMITIFRYYDYYIMTIDIKHYYYYVLISTVLLILLLSIFITTFKYYNYYY